MKSNNPNKSESLEPDSKVMKLTKVLSEMDEALMSTLHPRKTKVNCTHYTGIIAQNSISIDFPVYFRGFSTFSRTNLDKRIELYGNN